MPLPQTLLRWFESELAPGEEVRSAANADLWLRYRRLVLTDRRLLSVERFNARHPRRGRQVDSIPLKSIQQIQIRRGRMVTTLRFHTSAGTRTFQLLNRSLGTGRFVAAVRDLTPRPPSLRGKGVTLPDSVC